jgi:hypothetical protein
MKNPTINDKLYFLESFLKTNLSNDGLNVSIWCPFCRHSNKNKLKLAVHLEKNFYHCWLCDKKGSNIPFLISKISKTKSCESEKYFKKYTKKTFDLGLDINSLFGDYVIEEDDIDIVEIPKGFKVLANAYNEIDPDIRDVFRYAIKRGANKHKFWMLRLGYSNDKDFRRSLILPSLDEKGSINFYTARKIDADSSNPFKYNNANIKKKNVIFNELNIDWTIPLTIVEGPLDLLKTNDNSTCLLGSSLTKDMKLFKKIVENKTPVYLALDSDVYYKTLRIADLLYEYDIETFIVDTRSADDVGDMRIDQFEELLEKAKLYEKEDTLLSKISSL